MRSIYINKDYVNALKAYHVALDANLTIEKLMALFDYNDQETIEAQSTMVSLILDTKKIDITSYSIHEVTSSAAPRLTQFNKLEYLDGHYNRPNLECFNALSNCNNEILLYECEESTKGTFTERVLHALSLTHRIEDIMLMPLWSRYTDHMCNA